MLSFPEESDNFKPASGRYHLYVSYACPWAQRTLIVRKLKGLEKAISFDVVHWLLTDKGWLFDDSVGHHLTGVRFASWVF